ncbi:YggS family pyridoxal phosphate-dependent enzyme [uncultured Cytophaga sp.]|uniref:YggS family pyridoxal phosphate-dependent enzyme n=1 Tax=uncultured Cytophaga sp. TaxID=160238 RepID=UPI0026057D6F|nr:YggS family pyridoxal phosphate-dependent enzyme [uncultured Cytophaga sp.]
MNNIKTNLEHVHKRILNAAQHSGRDPKEIKLLLATKTVSYENICVALQLGETIIGENKTQELKEKYEGLTSIAHTTHFIGHLQTNKIKDVLKYADCIQSIDRLELVQKLDRRLQQEGRTMDIMLQVNTSNEESKFGLDPAASIDFAKEVSTFNTLKVKGLMTIGLFSSELEKVRKCYRLLKDIQSEMNALQLPNFELNELSMGMSGDLEIAIEEGATLIRVGTAIFGKRIHPDSYYWSEK